jgi:hypothetical protein
MNPEGPDHQFLTSAFGPHRWDYHEMGGLNSLGLVQNEGRAGVKVSLLFSAPAGILPVRLRLGYNTKVGTPYFVKISCAKP